jgi:hypothetical protein
LDQSDELVALANQLLDICSVSVEICAHEQNPIHRAKSQKRRLRVDIVAATRELHLHHPQLFRSRAPLELLLIEHHFRVRVEFRQIARTQCVFQRGRALVGTT